MAIVSGIDGAVAFATGYAASVTDWTITIAVEDLDTTSLGNAWRTHQPGLKSWNGNFTAHLDSAAADTLTEIAVGESAATATFTFGSGDTVVGSIMVTDFQYSVGTGNGPSQVTCTFVGSGAPTSPA